MTIDPSDVLARACASIADDRVADAGAIISTEYPFSPIEKSERRYSDLQSMRVFLRDGFIDRYSSTRLIFPGTLRLLSMQLPAEFPFHPNWRADAGHIAYWELSPTIDHLVPVSRGGSNEADNLITTSMLKNAAKGALTIAELGWQVFPPGDLTEWDGLTHWFLREFDRRGDLKGSSPLKKWASVARHCLSQSQSHRKDL